MIVEIKVPSVGESIREGVLGRWLVADGGHVEKGAAIFEFETDKTNTEVPSPASGRIELRAASGTTVEVGAVVALVDTEAASAASIAPPTTIMSMPDERPQPSIPARTPLVPTLPSVPVAAPAAAATGTAPAVSPLAGKMLAEAKIDPTQVKGSGTGGRVMSRDVAPLVTPAGGPGAPIPKVATPAAPPAMVPPPLPPPKAAAAPAPTGERTVRREPMSQIRRTIAQRLVESQQTTATLTTFNEIDMSHVMELRTSFKEKFEKRYGIGLGFMGFFLKAAVEALKEFPRVNAFIEGGEVVYHDYFDIGVAVSTEKGLMVPVIRNVDKLSFAELEKAIAAYAAKARDGKIEISDLQGGTFTVSNGGVFGSLLATPILNPPQSGILGMHKIEDRPVVVNKQIVIRPMMYVALSYDHRIIDGRESVGFLLRVKECIENPERMLLGV